MKQNFAEWFGRQSEKKDGIEEQKTKYYIA